MSKQSTPPNLPLRFFRWFCHPDYVEDIEGDLVERFYRKEEEQGLFVAKWLFVLDVLRLFRPGIVAALEGTQKLNYYGMFKNDVKIALRNFRRHKTYVAINMLGMGFALMCCIVTFLNLDYKLRFDEHHADKAKRVYRVNTVKVTEDGKEAWGLSPLALGAALFNDVPGLDHVVRLDSRQGIVNANGKTFAETVHYADMSLLQILNFPLVNGSVSAVNGSGTIALDEETAFKYFGYENPVGKQVSISDGAGSKKSFIVGAITQKVPENTSIIFSILVPFDQLMETGRLAAADWQLSPEISLFVAVAPGVEPATIDQQLNRYVEVNNNFREDQQVENFYLQPFSELAFTSDIDLPGWVRGRALNRNAVGFLVSITTFLSVLILLTACFNFTNTAIAFSGNRLKEIGIRKVIGSTRARLVYQFTVENLILCLLSIIVGLGGAFYLIDAYNGLFEQNLDMRYIFRSRVLLFLISLPVVVGILAGAYPAFKISGYEPVAILKGKTRFASMGWLGKFLLTAQFSVACFAIIGGIVLTQNAAYQQQLDFGYDLKNVAVAAVDGEEDLRLFESEVSKNPTISSLAGSAQVVGMSDEATVKMHHEEQGLKVRQLEVGANYLNTVGIDLLAGRDFVKSSAVDLERSVIVNQKMVDMLRLEGNALGAQMLINEKPYQVVGIAENHKEFGLLQDEPACVFTLAAPAEFRYLSMSTTEDKLPGLEAELSQAWYQVNPNTPYSGFFQEMLIYKQLYMNTLIRNLCLFLAVATLIMSAAGFFSIVSLSVQKRTKEIGIRKVFGGPVLKMIQLILKDFVKYMLIAFVIGSTLGGFVIHKVLFNQMYVYHIPFGVGAFLFALAIMLLVPSATVGYKVYKAATANPVLTLKHE